VSRPQTIVGYLADLNECLELGLRSRRRIFLEVVDHLEQAVDRHVRGGATRAVAEQRAIAAFGDPETVARSFESGPLCALDAWLAVNSRLLKGWMARHPWRAFFIKLVVVSVSLVGAAAVTKAMGGENLLHAVPWWLMASVVWLLWCSPQALLAGLRRRRRSKPATSSDPFGLVCVIGFPTLAALLLALGDPRNQGFFGFGGDAWVGLFVGTWLLVDPVCARALDVALRRRSEPSRAAKEQAWLDDHPVAAALFEIWAIPLALLVVVAVHGGPVGLRATIALLLATATAIVVVRLRLRQSHDEKKGFARGYGQAA